MRPPPTAGMTFFGKIVLTDDGLLFLPRSQQSHSAAGLMHAFGLIGMLVAQLMKSIKGIRWPFQVLASGGIEQRLQLVPKLGTYRPEQPVLILTQEEIVGFHSSFWKGLQVRTADRIEIVLSVYSRRTCTALFDAGGWRRLPR